MRRGDRLVLGAAAAALLGAALVGCGADRSRTPAAGSAAPSPSAPAGVAGVPVEAAPRTPPPGLPGLQCGEGTTYRPRAVAIACADAGLRAEELEWSGWSATEAVATGTYVANDCRPSCLAGTLRRYPGATFTFGAPLRDGWFSEVSVRFGAAAPGPGGARALEHFL